ncbi:MAG: hypothetical protein WBS33_05625 [Verrucomicrobiia bacterium]
MVPVYDGETYQRQPDKLNEQIKLLQESEGEKQIWRPYRESNPIDV